jgi:hypothetical protein
MPCGGMQVFERLWGTNELLSSFDSINCLPPSSALGVPNDQTSWLHADLLLHPGELWQGLCRSHLLLEEVSR